MMDTTIRMNVPFLTGNKLPYIEKAIESGIFSGDSTFTRKCEEFRREKRGFRRAFLTYSGTSALEMAALLAYIQQVDRIIQKIGRFFGNETGRDLPHSDD